MAQDNKSDESGVSSARARNKKKTTKSTSASTKSTRKTTAKKSNIVTAPLRSVSSATKALTVQSNPFTDAMSRATSANNMAGAAQQFSNFLKQTPFKMESLMNNKNFTMPQMDQFQNQMQSAANQCASYVSKATLAAEKSSRCVASGMEECLKTMTSIAQSNMQRANDAVRALAACRTINECADVQTRLFKQNFDAMSSETAKLVEQMTKTMTAAAEPVSDLAAESVTQIKKTMAA